MRTLFAISLIAAAFAGLAPVASADCIQTVCYIADGYDYGSCDQGALGQSVGGWSYNPGTAYASAGASTYCSNYGYYSSTGIGGGVGVCDASFNCYSVSAQWYEYTLYGNYRCVSTVDLYLDGQYVPQPLAICALAGGPPQVPNVLP